VIQIIERATGGLAIRWEKGDTTAPCPGFLHGGTCPGGGAEIMNPFLKPQYAKLLSALDNYRTAVLKGIPGEGKAEPTQEMKDTFREVCAAYLPLKDEPDRNLNFLQCLNSVACLPSFPIKGKRNTRSLSEIPLAEFDQWEILFLTSCPVTIKDAQIVKSVMSDNSGQRFSAGAPAFVRRVMISVNACCYNIKSPEGVSASDQAFDAILEDVNRTFDAARIAEKNKPVANLEKVKTEPLKQIGRAHV